MFDFRVKVRTATGTVEFTQTDFNSSRVLDNVHLRIGALVGVTITRIAE
jgi:hypothetical protein